MPFSVFQLFLTASLLVTIVVQANNYAQSKGVSLNLCVEELQAFIGINIAMGMLRLPQIRDYWSKVKFYVPHGLVRLCHGIDF